MPENPSAGRLYELVAFDKPVEDGDGQGGTVDGWAQQFTCRADYRFLRGTEVVQAARLAGRQPVIITVRSSISSRKATTDWRIRDVRTGTFDSGDKWTGTQFNIRAIARTKDRRYLEILAESGVAV